MTDFESPHLLSLQPPMSGGRHTTPPHIFFFQVLWFHVYFLIRVLGSIPIFFHHFSQMSSLYRNFGSVASSYKQSVSQSEKKITIPQLPERKAVYLSKIYPASFHVRVDRA